MAEELDFESEFRALLGSEPFVPFTIVVASGDRYRVDDPAMISLGVDVVTVTGPSSYTIIRFFNIVSLELHEPRR